MFDQFRHSSLNVPLGRRILLATATAAAAAVCVLASGCGSDNGQNNSKPSYLFSFEGDNVVMSEGEGSSLSFRMPVDSTSKVVTWFTDRPERDAGIMKLTEFVAQWSKSGPDGFKSDPPNVSIIYGTDQKPLTMIATMSDVRLVKSGSGELLEAKMTVVPESTRAAFTKSSAHLANHAERATTPVAAPPSQLTKKVAVFVDPEVGLNDD